MSRICQSEGGRIITTFSGKKKFANEISNGETNGGSTRELQAAPQSEKNEELKLSLKQPVWHVLLLTVVTFKLYFIYWCYKNWRDLSRLIDAEGLGWGDAMRRPVEDTLPPTEKAQTATASLHEANKDTTAELSKAGNDDLISKLLPDHLASFKDASPFLRAFGVAIPYLNAYLFFTLTLGIARLQTAKSFAGDHPIICSTLIVFAWITLSMLSILPGAYFFLFSLCAIPLAFVQHWVNKFIDSKEEKGLLMRHGFTGGEMVVVIVGALWFGYLVSAFIMGSAK